MVKLKTYRCNQVVFLRLKMQNKPRFILPGGFWMLRRKIKRRSQSYNWQSKRRQTEWHWLDILWKSTMECKVWACVHSAQESSKQQSVRAAPTTRRCYSCTLRTAKSGFNSLWGDVSVSADCSQCFDLLSGEWSLTFLIRGSCISGIINERNCC